MNELFKKIGDMISYNLINGNYEVIDAEISINNFYRATIDMDGVKLVLSTPSDTDKHTFIMCHSLGDEISKYITPDAIELFGNWCDKNIGVKVINDKIKELENRKDYLLKK